MTQNDLGKAVGTSGDIIGKYERDEIKPSIEAARKIAKLIDTTVSYLLGETDEENILKDPEMQNLFHVLSKWPRLCRNVSIYFEVQKLKLT